MEQVDTIEKQIETNVYPLPTSAEVIKMLTELEVGYQFGISNPVSKAKKYITSIEKAINMGCMDKESCPALFMSDVLDWQIPDPKGKSIEEVRKIRDQIEIRVINLIKSFEENT
jgi:protein-tyrosine-phosphatase